MDMNSPGLIMREGTGLKTELIEGVEKNKNKIGKTKKVRSYELEMVNMVGIN